MGSDEYSANFEDYRRMEAYIDHRADVFMREELENACVAGRPADDLDVLESRNEVATEVWKKPHLLFNKMATDRAYAIRAVRNRFNSAQRRRERRGVQLTDELAGKLAARELRADQQEFVLEDVLQHCGGLTDEMRQVIVITVVEGMSLRKSANCLGMKKMRVFRLRKKALKLIAHYMTNVYGIPPAFTKGERDG